MPRFTVQHEFDFEPTYVVDAENNDREVIKFDECLPPTLRRRWATKIADDMNARKVQTFSDEEYPDGRQHA